MKNTSKIREINPDEITHLEVFDFDGTLVDTLVPELGKPIWLEKTGTDWPYRGWWGQKDSLSMEVFEGFEVLPEVIEGYEIAKANPNCYRVMMTGRLARNHKSGGVEEEVEVILAHHNLEFDKYLYNTGGRTESVKLRYLASLMSTFPNIKSVTLWDDRTSQIPTFEEWGETQKENGRIEDFTMHHVLGDHHNENP